MDIFAESRISPRACPYVYDDKNCMPKENLTPNNLNDIDDNNKQWMKREKKSAQA